MATRYRQQVGSERRLKLAPSGAYQSLCHCVSCAPCEGLIPAIETTTYKHLIRDILISRTGSRLPGSRVAGDGWFNKPFPCFEPWRTLLHGRVFLMGPYLSHKVSTCRCLSRALPAYSRVRTFTLCVRNRHGNKTST